MFLCVLQTYFKHLGSTQGTAVLKDDSVLARDSGIFPWIFTNSALLIKN